MLIEASTVFPNNFLIFVVFFVLDQLHRGYCHVLMLLGFLLPASPLEELGQQSLPFASVGLSSSRVTRILSPCGPCAEGEAGRKSPALERSILSPDKRELL